MSIPYDDARYLQWVEEMGKLVREFLDTEGNDEMTLRAEVETAIDNWAANNAPALPVERP